MNFSSINMGTKIFLLVVWLLLTIANVGAAPQDKIASDARCPVCGMFVGKFEVWITQIRYDESTVYSFDGVKDMMAYYHDPAAYNGPKQLKITEIWVKDYYSLKWLDARQAFFVIGSDVHGPMGHEFIPFSSKAGAESFKVDHKGSQVLSFTEITAALVDQLRVGNRMKNMKK
jgi:nitrous oxide reductase accessory protein NosL